MANKSTPISIFRILSDLIKSDNIITIDELDALEEACKLFNIDGICRKESDGITLAEAASIIRVKSEKAKSQLIQTMKTIALKDGECCRAESQLITAIEMVCNNPDSEIISLKLSNRPLLTTQLLYLEDKETTPAKAKLDTHFYELSQITKMGGLELIYIPKVAKHFRDYDRDDKKRNDLKQLLRLISPSSYDSDIENCIAAIQGMNTQFFFRTVLNDKLGMNLNINSPSWIIRLPDSSVLGEGYANYLRFNVQKDIREQLINFTEKLNEKQGAYSIIINDGRDKENNFHYNGFYKVLLDVMSIKRIEKWDLHIRLYGDGAPLYKYEENGKFKKCSMTIKKGSEEHPIPITGRDIAFYVMLLCATVANGKGINFHDKKMKALIQKIYEDIYERVSIRDSDKVNVWEPQYRIPMKSRIKKAITNSHIAKLSSLQHLYMPVETDNGCMQIPVEPERVYLDTRDTSEKILDSELYKVFCANYKKGSES